MSFTMSLNMYGNVFYHVIKHLWQCLSQYYYTMHMLMSFTMLFQNQDILDQEYME